MLRRGAGREGVVARRRGVDGRLLVPPPYATVTTPEHSPHLRADAGCRCEANVRASHARGMGAKRESSHWHRGQGGHARRRGKLSCKAIAKAAPRKQDGSSSRDEGQSGAKQSQPTPTTILPAMAKAPPRPGAVDSSHPGIAPDVGPDDPRRFTDSGIEIQPVYEPEDIADLDLEERLGEPGEYPFTRGIHPEMYRSRRWTMRQYAGLRDRAGDQHPLPVPAREGLDRPVDGVRPADAARARLRRPAVPRRGRAAPASRSTRSTTCARRSTRSRSTRSRPR